jgi:TorA maturation chaperone TorD
MDTILLYENEFLLLAKARASFYAFLNIYFTVLPDEQFVQSVRKDEFRGVLDNLKRDQEVHPEIAEGARLMRDYLSATKDLEPQKLAERLGIDRTRLYRGITPDFGPPPPYEALWVGNANDGTEVLQEISHTYSESEFTLADDTHERLDYMGIELDYLEQLVQKEISARETQDVDRVRSAVECQYTFWKQHLGKWAPNYITTALEYADTDFYQGHLRMLNGFIEQEKEVLREIVEKYSGLDTSYVKC